MMIEDRATFDGMLARLRNEGEDEWRMVIHPTPNEADAKEVRFINRKHERPVRISTDPVTGELL